MQRLFRQNSMYGRLGRTGQRREAGFDGMLADMPGQRLPAPDFGRIAQILRFRARHMHHPGFGSVADYRLFGAMVVVFQRRHWTHRQRLCHPF